jgi:carbon monoxide dehydrogenase subunit G
LRFEQRFEVARDPGAVWTFLWDVPKLASCLPGVVEARPTEDPRRYTAVVAERVGPFQVRFYLDVEVAEVDEGRRVRAVASGKDSKLASQMRVDLEVRLAPEGAGTAVDVAADVTVLGKLGTLGHSVIKRRGEEVVAKFAQNLRAALGGAVSV